MPETFPVVNSATGELVDTPHYSVDEVAGLLHMHPSTVHRLMRRDRWPHLAIGNRVWFAPEDVTAALVRMRRNDEPAPEPPPDDGGDGGEGPALGLALPDDDEPGDADPGGIR